MNSTRRSSFARAAPTFGAALGLLWLASPATPGAAISWRPRLPLTFWSAPAPSVSVFSAPRPIALPAPAPAAPAVPATPVVAADPLSATPYAQEIRAASRRHGVDPLLVAAIVEVESNFSPTAVSPKGAVGLMQLMPIQFEPSSLPLEPHVNLDLGTRYIGSLVRRFGDLPTALAAYHAGPTAVERSGGVAPYPSTRWYVRRVLSLYERHRAVAGAPSPGPATDSSTTTIAATL